MAEYIEREAAIKAIYDSEPFGVHKYFWWRAMDIEEALRAIPAVDVAPVVHCKDCARRTEMGNCGHPRYHRFLPPAYPYDFCSYGKRKEND